MAAFNTIARAFEKANSGVKVKVEQLPYDQMRTTLDARLQSGQGPDLFRVTYNDIGIYSSQGVLADLSATVGADSGPVHRRPVGGRAVPGQALRRPAPHRHERDPLQQGALREGRHHRRADHPRHRLDLGAVPGGRREAERRPAPALSAAFGVNWQQYGAYRWFNWPWQAGGKALAPDGKSVVFDSPQARQTLEFTKSFYDKGLMPKNMMVKTANSPDLVFGSGKISMAFVGDFLLPDINKTAKGIEIGATFLPKGPGGAAADLGGNAVAVTTQSKSPEAAAAFAKFLAEPANMQLFCEQTDGAPGPQGPGRGHAELRGLPDLMPVFQQQATTMPADLVQFVTLPGFSRRERRAGAEPGGLLHRRPVGRRHRRRDHAPPSRRRCPPKRRPDGNGPDAADARGADRPGVRRTGGGRLRGLHSSGR